MSAPAKILYTISHGPYSNAYGQEALDAILIGASFELDVSVLFLNDGVFQIKQGQNNANSKLKKYTNTFKALADFGVENCYVHDLSLIARGLELNDLSVDTQLLNSEAVTALIAEQSKVFTF